MKPPRHIVRRTSLPPNSTHPLVTPLMPSVVYGADSPDALDDMYEGRAPGYAYAREGHPNADVLAAKIDRLEGAEGGLITGSGMAAVTAALLPHLGPGDHVLASQDLYGRTLRLLSEEMPRLGIEVSYGDPTDAAAFAQALQPNTKIVLIETVSNPTLRVADVPGIARAAKTAGALVVLDNTFTTPRAFQAFDHGADIVVHSVTKMLAGHSDTTLGYVGTRTPALRERMADFAISTGLTPSPFDCWLAERGMHTFELRYDKAEANAAHIADA
ncbi:MAG: aminotransferase class V-fold PLP-dependent enzyme, partial [Pseudomonadota bacterium]